ncbi:hypothetical protein [Micromonospora siamensis]|uniref:Uncharacterized protein n=1 Tax=Micromonospora siamensis TaxID=299152 RepID=A0A1C5GZW9_9ACTN|nr:hypothetical protein [Micromonospora siamensis]SCG39233.1 hypothetical protein GA0074704_0791 [Micromonospora siamensis]
MGESGAGQREPERTGQRAVGRDVEPDVLLDIPEVSVESIRLAVDRLDADVSLRTRLANLLQLDAGVRVHIEGVELDITGVHAEALLKVRLEKLVDILDRALTTIDRNPEIILALARTAELGVTETTGAATRIADEAAAVVGEPLGTIEGAADQAGRQLGSINRVTDEALRTQADVDAGPRSPEPPGGVPATGPAAGPEAPAGPRSVPPAEGPAASAAERTRPAVGKTGAERAEPAFRESSGTGGRTERGRAGRPGARTGGPSGVTGGQLTSQAGESLRQAGRSVWEAIQGGIAQRRQGQQRPDR